MRVEGEVPRGEPRVLPLVGHRDDVGEGEVPPARCCGRRAGAARSGAGAGGVAVEPLGDVVAVELLGPQQAGEGAAGDVPVLVGQRRGG